MLKVCLPSVYPHARAVRSLLVHGSVFAQRHPGEPRFIPALMEPMEKTALKPLFCFLSVHGSFSIA